MSRSGTRTRSAIRPYVLRRVLLAVPTLFGVTLGAFAFSHVAPGDPAREHLRRVMPGRLPTPAQLEEARRDLGLDRSVPAQYASWLGRATRGDLGFSYSSRRPVTTELAERVPATLALTVPAALLVAALALPAGIVAATHHNQLADQALRATSLAVVCIPSFWLALVLIRAFAVKLSLVPVAGRGSLSSFVLPVLTLALGPAAVLARFTRAAMLDILHQDYLRTARAKGVRDLTVVAKHGLRNALLPLVSAFGLTVGALLAGDVVVETVFAWPGAGRLARDAVLARDYPVIAGFVLFAGAWFVALNLLIDISYAVIDPRVTLDDAGEGS